MMKTLQTTCAMRNKRKQRKHIHFKNLTFLNRSRLFNHEKKTTKMSLFEKIRLKFK